MAPNICCYLNILVLSLCQALFLFSLYTTGLSPLPSVKEAQTFTQQCVHSLTCLPISLLHNILIIHLYRKHCNPFASTSQVQQCDHSLDSYTHSKASICLMDYRSKLVTITCLQYLLAVLLIARTMFSASDKSLL